MLTKSQINTMDLPLICPNCGQPHTVEQYPTLPTECQMQLTVIDLSNKFEKAHIPTL